MDTRGFQRVTHHTPHTTHHTAHTPHHNTRHNTTHHNNTTTTPHDTDNKHVRLVPVHMETFRTYSKNNNGRTRQDGEQISETGRSSSTIDGGHRSRHSFFRREEEAQTLMRRFCLWTRIQRRSLQLTARISSTPRRRTSQRPSWR